MVTFCHNSLASAMQAAAAEVPGANLRNRYNGRRRRRDAACHPAIAAWSADML
jgi:hypothetical protein